MANFFGLKKINSFRKTKFEQISSVLDL